MLPGGTDPGYRALLAGAHEPLTRIEVWRSGVRIDPFGDEGLPFFDGSISATLASQVTRQLSVSTDEALWPDDPDDLLSPYGNELRVFQGVTGGAQIPYIWQTFRGRINEAVLSSSGRTEIRCLDRAADVNDAGFLLPENSNAGTPVTTEFRRLVLDGVLDAEFGAFDAILSLVPALTWEWDRGAACDDLATAASAYWYALADGSYVMRVIPWTTDTPPVITLSDEEGGSLITAEPTRSREDVFNAVTVIGERADGTTPVFATVVDFDQSSPTYARGPFGTKSKLVRAQVAINQAQADFIARTALRQARALTESWAIEMPADPSLELGDTVIISARGLPPQAQVVASFTMPLAAGPMNVALRAQQPNLEEF